MKKHLVITAAALLCAIGPALAEVHQRAGQGGIVVTQDAPVYKKRGGEVEYRIARGDAVAALIGSAVMPLAFTFDEAQGQAKVLYYQKGKRMETTGFMNMKDLAVFAYDGSCSSAGGPIGGGFAGGLHSGWNPCFQEARDAKLAELQAKWKAEGKPATDPNAASPAP